jgi:hypothetical protein
MAEIVRCPYSNLGDQLRLMLRRVVRETLFECQVNGPLSSSLLRVFRTAGLQSASALQAYLASMWKFRPEIKLPCHPVGPCSQIDPCSRWRIACFWLLRHASRTH